MFHDRTLLKHAGRDIQDENDGGQFQETAFGQAVSYVLSKVGKPEMVIKNELWRPYAYNFYIDAMEAAITFGQHNRKYRPQKAYMFCFHGE